MWPVPNWASMMLVTLSFLASCILNIHAASSSIYARSHQINDPSSNRLTLPFNNGLVVIDLPKNALRLPKNGLTRKQGSQRLAYSSSPITRTTRILPSGGQTNWEPMQPKPRRVHKQWSAMMSERRGPGETRPSTNKKRMTLYIPTVAQTMRVNSINEQLPSYRINRPQQSGPGSGAPGNINQNMLQELAPLFVPIDSRAPARPPLPPSSNNNDGDLLPNALVEQILAEIIPKIEAEDRARRNPSSVSVAVPREQDEGMPYMTGGVDSYSGYQASANLVAKPKPFSTFRNIVRNSKLSASSSSPAQGGYSSPWQQSQQIQQVQQQQQQEEEPISQEKEPVQQQSYEPLQEPEQQRTYEPPPPPPPVKGPPPPPPRVPAPVKGPPPPPRPIPPPVKGPPPPPPPRPAPVKGLPPPPSKGRPSPPPAPIKGNPPPPPPPVKGRPAPLPPPPPPPPVKGRPAPVQEQLPLPPPAKGYPAPPPPAPIKGRPPPAPVQRPIPPPPIQSYPTKGQRPIPAPAPVKGRPAPPPQQQEQYDEPPQQQQQQQQQPQEYEPTPVKGQRPYGQQTQQLQQPSYTDTSPPPPSSTTTILYDERATYTNPVEPVTRGYQDGPNADIGFDDESAAFSEEDMPSKMPLDDEPEYTNARLQVSNHSVSDDYNRPRTVAPIRNLPLSPANKARNQPTREDEESSGSSGDSGDSEDYEDSSHSGPSSSLRTGIGSYGERIRRPTESELNDEASNTSKSRVGVRSQTRAKGRIRRQTKDECITSGKSTK